MLLSLNIRLNVSSSALRARFKIKFKDPEPWHGHRAHDFRVYPHGRDAHATFSSRSGTTESFRLLSA
jgi:hypothetical protein